MERPAVALLRLSDPRCRFGAWELAGPAISHAASLRQACACGFLHVVQTSRSGGVLPHFGVDRD
jgi:hypothetical protein